MNARARKATEWTVFAVLCAAVALVWGAREVQRHQARWDSANALQREAESRGFYFGGPSHA